MSLNLSQKNISYWFTAFYPCRVYISGKMHFQTLRKISKFLLISLRENFVERQSFRRILCESPETLQKLYLSIEFAHQGIRWDSDILRSKIWLYTFAFFPNSLCNLQDLFCRFNDAVFLFANVNLHMINFYGKNLCFLSQKMLPYPCSRYGKWLEENQFSTRNIHTKFCQLNDNIDFFAL